MNEYSRGENDRGRPFIAPSRSTDASGGRILDRLPLVGRWVRRRRARVEHLPALRRRVRDTYDVDRLAATVVRAGIVDPSEDIVDALAAVHLSRLLDPDGASSAVPVAETERFVVHYGMAPDSPSTVSGPLWTLAREASYRQARATLGSEFVERVEADYGHHCRTLLGKGGWLVLSKPPERWTSEPTWTLTATRTPRDGYGVRGTCDDADLRREYALTDGRLTCRTVRPGRDGTPRSVIDRSALAPADRTDYRAVWGLVAADFEVWRAVAATPDAAADRRAGARLAGRRSAGTSGADD